MHVQAVLAPRSVITAALDRWLDRRQAGSSNPEVLSVLQHLVGEGVITQVSATAALNAYTQDDLPLDEAIAAASLMPRLLIAKALASYNSLPFESLQLVEQRLKRMNALGQEIERTLFVDPIQEQTITLITLEQARQYSAIPVRDDGNKLTIGFADPLYADDLKHVHQLLKRDINPVMVSREEMEDALQRTLGRKTIGTYLLLDGLISRVQLNQALDIARRTGVRLGQALINRGFITDDQLYRYLAKQSSLPLVDLDSLSIDAKLAGSLPHAFERQNGVLPIQRMNGTITLATVDPFNTTGVEQVRLRLGEKISLVLVTESDFEAALERLFKGSYLAQSTSELLERAPQDSAFRVLTRAQAIALAGLAIGSLVWLWFDFNSYIILINALATLFYVGFSSYKFYLVYHALSYNMEMKVSPEELESLDDRDLPVYTLLIPAYKEAEVLPELLGALNRLDYPPTKLDIQVLMEQGDPATIKAYDEWKPASHFHRVIVPSSVPMTKPKACNYGLIHARGEYVVIYDAEDLPEPDQLKKVVAAFAKAPADVACIQSKLNYFNSEQNILTQWFTIEYSMWFDLFLPGLAASHAPIPLGGTSNHFKRNSLVEIGAWDPYNVTEDADLGIRLFKRGYKTAIVDSTTYEEANSRLYNWLRQRSRWIKGYIQTWLVHMRNPLRLIRDIGIMPFLSFQFVVGGTVFAALLNPIYWLLTTVWFLVHWQFIEAIFPGVIHFLGAVALFIGNFAFTYMNVAGALRREKYNMVKYALVSPIYWGLASIGAWMGFIQLLYKPHFWEKTHHGFSKDNGVPDVIPITEEPATPVDLFDIHIQGEHGNRR
jgi:cellulose synthase/poly-beta-1,6-N-acetylglucosamine synthase-like glycosyltransferase